jgi:hypothetical protein
MVAIAIEIEYMSVDSRFLQLTSDYISIVLMSYHDMLCTEIHKSKNTVYLQFENNLFKNKK